jgi:hypothetical protein
MNADERRQDGEENSNVTRASRPCLVRSDYQSR